jgi:integrase
LLDESRNASPLVRISVLLSAYSGARLAEIVEASTLDFEERAGHLIFQIREDNRDDGQTVKTDESVRRFPLHSCVVKEVRAYLASIPEGPLFAQVTLRGKSGKRSENAGAQINGWIQDVAGIESKTFHYFRHTWKTAMRGFIPGEDIRDAITGHKNGSVGRAYGRFPIATLAKAMESVPADPMLWEIE